jgi:glycosyltransferase involved in cell wall biosynthesis
MQNVSLILTIKNEENTIVALLDSIIEQTRCPTEIIIVDGGSSDDTVKIVKSYKDRLQINLIICPKVNIAKGRNIAIQNAANDIIACTDGGCILEKNWLENIIKPIEASLEIDVVSGVYLPYCENEFEETAANLLFPSINSLNADSFLPSGRSIAFRKRAWKMVGGYPEWLNTAEDTLFDLKLKKTGLKFVLSPNSIVFWRVRKDLAGIFRQYYYYAQGEGHALLFKVNYAIRYGSLAFIVALLFLAPSNVYLWLLIIISIVAGLFIKHIRKVKLYSYKRIAFAIPIALAFELGITIGFIVGLLKRFKNVQSIRSKGNL